MTDAFTACLRRLVRQSLVALVLFSTVATAFGLTARTHAAAAHEAACAPPGLGVEDCLTACAALAVEAVEEHGESAPCDQCHCQIPTVGMPSGLPNWIVPTGHPCARRTLIVIRPDGYSPAPEPPPIRT